MKKNKAHYKKGSAMLIAVIFFLAISFVIAGGAIGPTLREVNVANNLLDAKNSLYLAESGTEDVFYRLRNGVTVSPSETLTMGNTSVVTTVTDTTGGKEIDSRSSYSGYVRKNSVNLITGIGIAFNYGLQTGNGGFDIANNAFVSGNVYSNGDIVGSNGAYITGTAIAANSIPLTADARNEIPAAPQSNITFGNTAATQDFAQSFSISTTTAITKIELYIRKVGTPSNATVKIVPDNNGKPDSSAVMTTATLSAGLVQTTYGWVPLALATNPTLNAGSIYWFVIDGSTNTSSKYYQVGGNNNGYNSGEGKTGQLGGTWTSTDDGYFRVYIGGQTSEIKNIKVGTVAGDARANKVTNVTVSGTLYCQTGSGNNKSCNTSQPDPVPLAFPLTDAMLSHFEEEAESGTIINSNYTPAAGTTLGPAKINGNLVLNNGGTVTITGTIWVTGYIILNNNSKMKLDIAYGSNSGTVLVDGTINISNGGSFVGSGQTGSYVMITTRSQCPYDSNCSGANAVEISNNAGAVIVNAQRGAAHLNNNAGIKEVTADKVIIDNNSSITYDSGLANSQFTSGPSGGWNIKSWGETQ